MWTKDNLPKEQKQRNLRANKYIDVFQIRISEVSRQQAGITSQEQSISSGPYLRLTKAPAEEKDIK